MAGLVSIIMPSYNTASFIEKSIKTVIAQSYTNWELIIVDDCSSDETDSVVKPFLVDKRIRFLKNKINKGAAFSRNRALQEAKGKWVAFLDSDDLWYPDKLLKQIHFMEENDYHFSYTNYAEIDSEDNPIGRYITGPKKITKKGFYNYCWPGCLTVMYDSNVVGLIQIADIKKNNDYAMWLKICEKADCYLLNQELALYRRGRKGSVSTVNIKTMITWHYKLFRIADNKSCISALFLTCRNLFFGMIKKMIYTKEKQ